MLRMTSRAAHRQETAAFLTMPAFVEAAEAWISVDTSMLEVASTIIECKWDEESILARGWNN